MYRFDPSCYGAMFALPAKAAEICLNEADETEIKVLLHVFCHPENGISVDGLSSALQLSADGVLTALDFWVAHGVLQFTDERGNTRFVRSAAQKASPAADNANTAPAARPAAQSFAAASIPKPTMEQIGARLSEDETVRSLFLEAQRVLGRTFGLDVQTTLLALYDTYGLSKEVILTLLQHLTEKGRGSTANILKLGRTWAEREIETLDEANAYIQNDAAATALYRSLASAAGLANPRPTPKQTEHLLAWLEMGFSAEMVIKAYEEMADRTGKVSFAYMDKILRGWHAQGLKTPDAVDKSYQAAKAPRQPAAQRKTSYDLDEALKKATVSAKKLANDGKAG